MPRFFPRATRAACPALAVALILSGILSSGTAQAAQAAQAAPTAAHASTATHDVAPAPRVRVADAWIRWLPSRLPAAGYMVLENTGDRPVRLVGVTSPDYAMVMLHRTVRNGATTTMAQAPDLTLPPHEKVAIAPGGYHLMLEEPTRTLAPGATVQLDLRFSDGATLRTPVPVSAPTRTQ